MLLNDLACLLIYCVYTQFLKTISTFLSFLYLLTCPVRLHPFTKIPVQNDQPSIFSNCIHDVIQVEQICTTCKQKRYTCILLFKCCYAQSCPKLGDCDFKRKIPIKVLLSYYLGMVAHSCILELLFLEHAQYICLTWMIQLVHMAESRWPNKQKTGRPNY